jgi:hypothetical protein
MASAIVNDETLRLVHQVYLSQSERHPARWCLPTWATAPPAARSAPPWQKPWQELRSVCLVEANFRSPVEPGLFGATNDPGLPDALTRMGPDPLLHEAGRSSRKSLVAPL